MPSKKNIPTEPTRDNIKTLYEDYGWTATEIYDHIDKEVERRGEMQRVSKNAVYRALRGIDSYEPNKNKALSSGLARKLWEMEPEDMGLDGYGT